jgi:hypothetical protein
MHKILMTVAATVALFVGSHAAVAETVLVYSLSVYFEPPAANDTLCDLSEKSCCVVNGCYEAYAHPSFSGLGDPYQDFARLCGPDMYTSPEKYGQVQVVERGKHFSKVKVLRSFWAENYHKQQKPSSRSKCEVGATGVVDTSDLDLDIESTQAVIDRYQRQQQKSNEQADELQKMLKN